MLKFTRILNILLLLSLNFHAMEANCDKLTLSDDSNGGGGYICSSLHLDRMNDRLNKISVGQKSDL